MRTELYLCSKNQAKTGTKYPTLNLISKATTTFDAIRCNEKRHRKQNHWMKKDNKASRQSETKLTDVGK